MERPFWDSMVNSCSYLAHTLEALSVKPIVVLPVLHIQPLGATTIAFQAKACNTIVIYA